MSSNSRPFSVLDLHLIPVVQITVAVQVPVLLLLLLLHVSRGERAQMMVLGGQAVEALEVLAVVEVVAVDGDELLVGVELQRELGEAAVGADALVAHVVRGECAALLLDHEGHEVLDEAAVGGHEDRGTVLQLPAGLDVVANVLRDK